MATNNYFKSVGGKHIWFFDSTDVKSIQEAWDAAIAAGWEFSCWAPFPMDGPWFGSNLIGQPHKAVKGEGEDPRGRLSDEDEIDRRLDVLKLWQDTRRPRLIWTGIGKTF